jgi:hypothetical protein
MVISIKVGLARSEKRCKMKKIRQLYAEGVASQMSLSLGGIRKHAAPDGAKNGGGLTAFEQDLANSSIRLEYWLSQVLYLHIAGGNGVPTKVLFRHLSSQMIYGIRTVSAPHLRRTMAALL